MSSTSTRVLERSELLEWVAGRAPDVDQGERGILDALMLLGEQGLLEHDEARAGGRSLDDLLVLIEDIAGECLTTAFSVWAQTMVISFLSHAPGGACDDALTRLRSGQRIGATAMAPALRELCGLGPVPLVGRRVDGVLRVSGPVSWASHLFDGALVVAPVRVPEDGPDSRWVVGFAVGARGVRVHPGPALLALDATASSAMTLTDVVVDEGGILSRDMLGFAAARRPQLLLAQSAFCSGLARRAVSEVHERMRRRRGPLEQEAELRLAAADADVASVHDRLHAMAGAAADVQVRELLRLRLDAALAAGEATRLESLLSGGSGFIATSPTSRRLREAAFLPVQAPTELQLRWQLASAP